jgi:hypothetical protein
MEEGTCCLHLQGKELSLAWKNDVDIWNKKTGSRALNELVIVRRADFQTITSQKTVILILSQFVE